jgi:hypothetical protein
MTKLHPRVKFLGIAICIVISVNILLYYIPVPVILLPVLFGIAWGVFGIAAIIFAEYVYIEVYIRRRHW